MLINSENENDSFFSIIVNCIALLVLLIISCFVITLWSVRSEPYRIKNIVNRFIMLICCRDSVGIMEDIQNSFEETKHQTSPSPSVSRLSQHSRSVICIDHPRTINTHPKLPCNQIIHRLVPSMSFERFCFL